MTQLHLAEDLNLPAEFAGRRSALFGISGSGKSNSASVIIEEATAAGEQVVFIDPKGEAWGLLSLPSGKPSNLDMIIFGEPSGHIPSITEHHGPQLADFVVDSGRSIAVSMLGFESDASERRFAATFLRRLYKRKTQQAQKRKTRTLVVFEEAHLFMPEGGLAKGDVAELSGACQRIVRQGRSFGLGSLIIDQRPQDVAKRVITQCDTLICHQLTHNKDRQALAEWVSGYDRDGCGDEFLVSLATLQPGEAWIWSPAWLNIFQRVKMRRRRTFDSGASADDAAAVKVRRAEIDLDALKGQLDELVAQAKADDPKELKRRLADAEAKLKKATTSTAVGKPDAAAVQREVDRGVAAARSMWMDEKRTLERRLVQAGKIMRQIRALAVDDFCSIGEAQLARVEQTARRLIDPPLPREHRLPAPKVTPSADGDADVAVGKGGLRRILVALAQRQQGLSVAQVGCRAGLSSKSGTFDTYLSRARKAGWIDGSRSLLRITDGGLAALGSYEPLPTGRELLRHWVGELGNGGASRMLEALAATYPRTLTAEELGETIGMALSGTFDTYLSRLRRLELITGGRGGLKAADELFAE